MFPILFLVLLVGSFSIVIPTGSKTPLEKRPVVLITLIAINFAVYVVQVFVWLVSPESSEAIARTFGFIPADKTLYTYVTYLFIHAGFLHLLFNMLFLWIYGANLEDRIGHAEFLVLYLVSGICGALLHTATVPMLQFELPLIGASGAVYGILGGCLLLIPLVEIRMTWLIFFVKPINFYVAVFWLVPLRVILDLILAAYSRYAVIETAYWDHIGGFLVGAAYGGYEIWWAKHHPAEEDYGGNSGLGERASERSREVEEAKRSLRESLVNDDFAAGWRIYLGLLKVHPGVLPNSEDLLVLAARAEAAGEFDDAIQVYRRIANSDRLHVDRSRAACRVGELLVTEYKRLEEAALIFQKVIYQFPTTDTVRDAENNLKEALRKMAQADEGCTKEEE